jgi:hypothetical protein
MNYPNGYQPTEAKPEVKPPKCGSAESSSAANKANIELLDELYNENAKLRKKLKKVRKEKKRWKRKYLELYNYVKMMEGTTYVTIKDPMLERIEAGLGIPPIKPLNEDSLKPTKPIKSRVKPGSMDYLYEV